MGDFRPVSISKGGFAFCRYTVAALVWVALLTRQKGFLIVTFLILALSWVLKIEKAPLIVLYRHTADRLMKPETVVLDESGMRFAHGVGAVMSGVALLLLYLVPGPAGWIFTAFLAVMKTSAALGRCSALKLYTCMKGGNCCRFGRYLREKRHV